MSVSAVRRRLPVAALALAFVTTGIGGQAAPVSAAPSELFFSEYIEGTSFNKALEIYNGTGASIDLGPAGYNVQLYSNGAATPTSTTPLAGVVTHGDVFVIAHTSANAALIAEADQQSGNINHNGDDAYVLRKDTTVLDVIGQVGFDPGTEWGSGLTSTADNTLRRKSTIEAGDANGSDAFDPSAEWDGYAVDTFDGFGAHSATGGTGDTAPSVSSTDPADGERDVARDSDITITFSEPVDVSGAWYSISCDSGSYAATASGGPTTFTLHPEADFGAGENCTVTIDADGVTDRDGTPDNMASDYVFSFTAGGVEACTPGGAGVTRTYEIQGAGGASPLVGQTVTTQGVVTGDFETFSALAGFYIQDPLGDGSPATSDGLFIYNLAADDVAVGDVVGVTGKVVEFNGITELTDVSITGCSEGAAVPTTPILLPEEENGDLEQYEGMHVTFAQELTISQNFFLGRYGQLTLSSGGRMYNPTNLYRPGTPEAVAEADENARRVIILDDGRSSQNPNPIPYIGEDDTNRAGDTITGLTGNVDYGLITSNSTTRDYRIQPTAPVVIDRENERMAEPEDVGGRIQVAAFNVLNYFDTIDQEGASCYPSGTRSDCRGADSDAEFARQRDKIITAITAMDADIVGLMEIENDASGDAAVDSSIEDLVEGLNAEAGAGTYDFIDTGTIGGDAIKVALIYQPGSVTPVGAFDTLTTEEDPRFLDDQNRPPLAQTFSENESDERLTVVVNHLKSKGSDCDDLGDFDLGDGQGNCNKTREAAAEAIVDWLATDPTDSDDADFMIIGDLNSYAREDPIVAFEEGGYTNLSREFIGTAAYTYVFDGWSGNLDYALASESVVDQVTGVTEWHINTDEPSVIDYNTEFKPQDLYQPDAFRSSDHDPVIVGLALMSAAPEPPRLDIDDVTGEEGDSETTDFVFTVTRTGDTSGASSVRYHTEDGTAKTPQDYVAIEDAELTFAPGDESATITVKVVGDGKRAPDEDFFVVLSDASGATIGDGRGTGTILYDDPFLTIGNVVVREPANGFVKARLRVALSYPTISGVTVRYRTRDGSATGGLDYTVKSDGVLNFPPGDSVRYARVKVLADLVDEDRERFFVDLFDATGPDGPLRIEDGTGKVRIED